MPVVHEPSLQLLQFVAHFPPLLGSLLCLCALLFGELAVLGSSLCESRKAILGPRTGARPSMELAAPHRESSRTLAQSTPTGLGLATNTLPVWTVEPWFGIGFHSAQLASVYGVLLYPILDGFARHAWLGSRSTGPAKTSNTDWAHAKLTVGRRCVLYCPIVDWLRISKLVVGLKRSFNQVAANGGLEPEVTDAAACTFLHEGRIAAIRCARMIYLCLNLKRTFFRFSFVTKISVDCH